MSPEAKPRNQATGEGQPLAPYRSREGRSKFLPLTDRVALALKRAARRGLLSPNAEER